MSDTTEKKTLQPEELETVTGGETFTSLEEISFLYGKGFHVEVRKFNLLNLHVFTSGGKITKRGYTNKNGLYSPCYYIKCDDDDDSGWYDEDYLADSSYTSWRKIDGPVTFVD